MNDEQEKEARFVAAIRHELDRASATLGTAAQARLRAIRRRALDATPRPRAWLLAGGLATAALSAVLVAVLLLTPALTPPVADFEQFDLLSENDSLELYGDLEFYRWLAARTDAS